MLKRIYHNALTPDALSLLCFRLLWRARAANNTVPSGRVRSGYWGASDLEAGSDPGETTDSAGDGWLTWHRRGDGSRAGGAWLRCSLHLPQQTDARGSSGGKNHSTRRSRFGRSV